MHDRIMRKVLNKKNVLINYTKRFASRQLHNSTHINTYMHAKRGAKCNRKMSSNFYNGINVFLNFLFDMYQSSFMSSQINEMKECTHCYFTILNHRKKGPV